MKNKKKLLIIGASGHGKVVADIALQTDEWLEVAFLDDDKNRKKIMGLDVIGNTSEIAQYIDEYSMFVAIGNNEIRESFFINLENIGASLPILIHPNVTLGNDVKIDKGTVIMAGAIINCCSEIGKGCIINTGATVDHDNEIADFVHISPGAHLAGAVKVGKGSWLGIGSVVSNNINITNGCTMGAGAVLVNNITNTGVYVGIPAKKID